MGARDAGAAQKGTAVNRRKPTTVYPAEVRRCVVDLVKIVKRGAFCIRKPGKSNMDTCDAMAERLIELLYSRGREETWR